MTIAAQHNVVTSSWRHTLVWKPKRIRYLFSILQNRKKPNGDENSSKKKKDKTPQGQ